MYLKQNTAATLTIGPLVDKTDATTPEVGITTTSATVIELWKHDATVSVDLTGTTTFTHRGNGIYTLTLSITDTDTVGRIRIVLLETATMRPFTAEFTVLPANTYDSLIGGSDKLQVDTTQWIGNAVTVDSNNLPDVNMKAISQDTAAADTLESYTDGTANIPADMTKISGSATGADNLELYTTGASNIPASIAAIVSSVDLSTTMISTLDGRIDNRLNTPIPPTPAVNSVFERIQTMDNLVASGGSGDLAAMKSAIITDGVQVDMSQSVSESPASLSIGNAFYNSIAFMQHKQVINGLDIETYKSDGSTIYSTRTMDVAVNPKTLS